MNVQQTTRREEPAPRAKPEDAGLSSSRLAEIAAVLNADIERGQLPGAVLMIVRRGMLAYCEAFGDRDKAAGVPMTIDTIFNIASMTKPVTAVAALQLIERGHLSIDDPIEKFLPKFSGQRVAVMDGERLAGTVPVQRSVTIQELMRHTCGMIYGSRGTTVLHRMYPDGSGTAAARMTATEFLDGLAELPLLHQPGTVWDYGFGLDVLGLIVETLTGQTLGRYLRENVFDPLGMTDTGFLIPPDKASRYARALPNDPLTGKPQSLQALTERTKFESGGGGLAGIASDYLRFALMLLN